MARLPAPELLISVRNQEEFDAALATEVDVVDLKEPRNGALAPADSELWTHAARVFSRLQGTQPQLSAALGERSDALQVADRLPPEFAYAKVGPSGCRSTIQLTQLWSEMRQRLAEPTELVAVAYADHNQASCLDAESIFLLASEAGFQYCLIDTFMKDGRSTIDHLGIDGLVTLDCVAREQGLWWAMAGSIRLDCVETLWKGDVRPNCFGVRGDVCKGGRKGTLSISRIRAWQRMLANQVTSLGPIETR